MYSFYIAAGLYPTRNASKIIEDYLHFEDTESSWNFKSNLVPAKL